MNSCNHLYDLGKILGQGGFGTVYEGRCRHCGAQVAVKTLSDPRDAEARRLFVREVRMLKRLRHENIIPLLGWNTNAAQPWYAMPLMSGGTLTEYAGELTFDQIVAIAYVVATALQHIHSQNAIHRDIKPDNLLVSYRGSIRVGDFGVGNHPMCTVRYTVNLHGTPGYMAPDSEASPASDIYSLGATLYHLVTGRRPLESGPLDIGVEAPSGLRRLVQRMTSPTPAQRPSAWDLVIALGVVDDEPAPAPKPKKAPGSDRSDPWEFLAGLVGAVAVGGGLVALASAFLGGDDDEDEDEFE